MNREEPSARTRHRGRPRVCLRGASITIRRRPLERDAENEKHSGGSDITKNHYRLVESILLYGGYQISVYALGA